MCAIGRMLKVCVRALKAETGRREEGGMRRRGMKEEKGEGEEKGEEGGRAGARGGAPGGRTVTFVLISGIRQ